MKTKPCPRCGGSGKIADDREIGAYLKAKRQRAKLRQKHVADRMGVSVPYLSDLENGNRQWSGERRQAYLAALAE